MSSSAINIKGSLGRDALRNQISNASFASWDRGNTFDFTVTHSAVPTRVLTSNNWFVRYGSGESGTTTDNLTVDKRPHDIGESMVKGNPNYFLSINGGKVSPGTPDEADYLLALEQRIPNVRLLQNNPVTLSFYAKGASAGAKVAVGLRQVFGLSGGALDEFGLGGTASNPVFIPGKEVVLGNEWTRHSLQFNVPSISGKFIGSSGDNYTQLDFYLQAGATIANENNLLGAVDYSGTTVDFSNVQLETGVDVSEFENIHQNYAIQQMVGPRIVGAAGGLCTRASTSVEGALGMSYDGVTHTSMPAGATLFINLNDSSTITGNNIRRFGSFFDNEPLSSPIFIVSPTFSEHDATSTDDTPIEDIICTAANTTDRRVLAIKSSVNVGSTNNENRPFNIFAIQLGEVGSDILFNPDMFGEPGCGNGLEWCESTGECVGDASDPFACPQTNP
jgi:hypothetical protein